MHVSRRQSRQRRRIKPLVAAAFWCICAVLVYFYYSSSHLTPLIQPNDDILLNMIQGGKQLQLPDSSIHRNHTSLGDFLMDASSTTTLEATTKITIQEASKGREPILKLLREAGIVDKDAADILALPTWEGVQTLCGEGPHFLEDFERQCQRFRQLVPPSQRFLAISGMFNSGTTAFGLSLQANCRYPNRDKQDEPASNDVLSNRNGMLNQVPWAKHKMASWKDNTTIHDGIPKEKVLPLVLVRDPYYWMQSMCKQGYGARWDHNSQRHCPNLVPNDWDRQRFKTLRNASSVLVWMGANRHVGPSWDSLVHYWNDWYHSYLEADFPRIVIRFEDVLFHGKQVLQRVCEECGGAEFESGAYFQYLVDEAKWNHKHQQNNLVSAMIKYGTERTRFRNMTSEDLKFAKKHLDGNLMKLFHYKEV